MVTYKRKRHTTFRTYRGAPIELKPGVTPDDVTNPDELREALREELKKTRLGIVWTYRGTADEPLRTPLDAQETPDGNVIYCDYAAHIIRIVDKITLETVWQVGTYGVANSPIWAPHGVYPEDDTVLVAEQRALGPTDGRVISVDKDTKAITEIITGLYRPVSVKVDPEDDQLIIADTLNHRVIKCDRQGNITWQFGVTGVRGDDLTHLNMPAYAIPYRASYGLPYDYIAISEYGNNRIVIVKKSDKSIYWHHYVPGGVGGISLIPDLEGNAILASTEHAGIRKYARYANYKSVADWMWNGDGLIGAESAIASKTGRNFYITGAGLKALIEVDSTITEMVLGPADYGGVQPFIDLEIRDKDTHNGEIMYIMHLRNKTIRVRNNLDQDVTLQLQGDHHWNFSNPVNVGSPFTVSAGSQDYQTVTDYFPYLRPQASCAVAPTSGALDLWVFACR